MPNAYYNFLKNRKSAYHIKKQNVLSEITSIYHKHGGVDGYRSMKVYLERKGFCYSNLTVHKYMNMELRLYSVVRRKKPGYIKSRPHKVFKNLISQDLLLGRQIKNGAQTSHIFFLQMEVNAIIARF